MHAIPYVDADGHIIEPPQAFMDFAPAAYRERVWHIDTDSNGKEWIVMDGRREPANVYAAGAAAGLSEAEKARAFRGELRFSEIPRGGAAL